MFPFCAVLWWLELDKFVMAFTNGDQVLLKHTLYDYLLFNNFLRNYFFAYLVDKYTLC